MPDPESSADRIVASLHNVDEKVNALREQRINDPDDLCDKMFKVAAPTLAGLVFGKLFELAWRKSVGRKAVLPDGTTDKRKELALNLVFGVASAGLGALVSQLSDRGSQAQISPDPQTIPLQLPYFEACDSDLQLKLRLEPHETARNCDWKECACGRKYLRNYADGI